jgi:hypothetical protein
MATAEIKEITFTLVGMTCAVEKCAHLGRRFAIGRKTCPCGAALVRAAKPTGRVEKRFFVDGKAVSSTCGASVKRNILDRSPLLAVPEMKAVTGKCGRAASAVDAKAGYAVCEEHEP